MTTMYSYTNPMTGVTVKTSSSTALVPTSTGYQPISRVGTTYQSTTTTTTPSTSTYTAPKTTTTSTSTKSTSTSTASSSTSSGTIYQYLDPTKGLQYRYTDPNTLIPTTTGAMKPIGTVGTAMRITDVGKLEGRTQYIPTSTIISQAEATGYAAGKESWAANEGAQWIETKKELGLPVTQTDQINSFFNDRGINNAADLFASVKSGDTSLTSTAGVLSIKTSVPTKTQVASANYNSWLSQTHAENVANKEWMDQYEKDTAAQKKEYDSMNIFEKGIMSSQDIRSKNVESLQSTPNLFKEPGKAAKNVGAAAGNFGLGFIEGIAGLGATILNPGKTLKSLSQPDKMVSSMAKEAKSDPFGFAGSWVGFGEGVKVLGKGYNYLDLPKPAYRELKFDTEVKDYASTTRMIGLETPSGKAFNVGYLNNEGFGLGTPNISELKILSPKADIKIGSALETKAIRKTALNNPDWFANETRAKEFIPTGQAIISKTRNVKSAYAQDSFLLITERMPAKGVNIVLDVAKENKGTISGSFARSRELAPTYNINGEMFNLNKVPRDIDVHLDLLSAEQISGVAKDTLKRFKASGMDARLVSEGGTIKNAIEVRQPKGGYEKGVEFLGKGAIPEEEMVPDYVLGIKKIGSRTNVNGVESTMLNEELRGVMQGTARVRKVEGGKLDFYPVEKRMKDIGSVEVSARTLYQSKPYQYSLGKNLGKFESMFPKELVFEQLSPASAGVEKSILADFSGKGSSRSSAASFGTNLLMGSSGNKRSSSSNNLYDNNLFGSSSGKGKKYSSSLTLPKSSSFGMASLLTSSSSANIGSFSLFEPSTSSNNKTRRSSSPGRSSSSKSKAPSMFGPSILTSPSPSKSSSMFPSLPSIFSPSKSPSRSPSLYRMPSIYKFPSPSKYPSPSKMPPSPYKIPSPSKSPSKYNSPYPSPSPYKSPYKSPSPYPSLSPSPQKSTSPRISPYGSSSNERNPFSRMFERPRHKGKASKSEVYVLPDLFSVSKTEAATGKEAIAPRVTKNIFNLATGAFGGYTAGYIPTEQMRVGRSNKKKKKGEWLGW